MIWTGVYQADQDGVRGDVWRSAVARGRIRAQAPLASGLPGRGGSVTPEETRAIVERAREGDRAAFAELFAAFEADVTRVCRRMLGGPEASKDARAEVFLRARRALHGYDVTRPFRPWLLSIAGHYCIDQLRRRAAEAKIFSDAPIDVADLCEPGPSPLGRMVAAEAAGAVSEAIENLPVKYRLPLVMRYFGDSDYAGIAEALGVSRNQVGSLLLRAKRMLREQLADLAGREGSR